MRILRHSDKGHRGDRQGSVTLIQEKVFTEEAMSTNEHLLSLYLDLAPDARKAAFADTAKAARLVGVSQRTIQLWIQEKRIRAIRIGRRFQVDLESLKRYLNHSGE